MITVLDYGAGNLASLAGALKRHEIAFNVADQAAGVSADRSLLVLPGVGHFRAAKEALIERGLWALLQDAIAAQRPILGICLGLQLLAEGSEEAPGVSGLGALKGVATRLPEGVKVPHMGWSEIKVEHNESWPPPPPGFYFVHSFALAVTDQTTLSAEHGVAFSAASACKNTYGIQAHPERSGRDGQKFLAQLIQRQIACS